MIERQRAGHPSQGSAIGADLPIEALYVSHRLPMMRLAFVITGSSTVAEEMTQEAFLRLHKVWHSINNHPAYLRVTLVNLCRDHVRRRAYEDRLVRANDLATLQPEIDETWAAVCRLPFRQRAALALRYYADLSEADIASTLGCRPGTVKSTLHRGLSQLRKELS